MHSSRQLNPLNCSSSQATTRQSLLQPVYRDLTRATDCFQGKSMAPESCIQQLLAGWAKNCTSWAALNIAAKDLLPPGITREDKRDLTASSIAAGSRKGSPPNAAPNCHHAECCLEILTTGRTTTIPGLPMHPKMLRASDDDTH